MPGIFSVEVRLRKGGGGEFFVQRGGADFSIRKTGFERLMLMADRNRGVPSPGVTDPGATSEGEGEAERAAPPDRADLLGSPAAPLATGSRRSFLSLSVALGAAGLSWGRPARGSGDATQREMAAGAQSRAGSPGGKPPRGPRPPEARPAETAAPADVAVRPKAFKISLAQWSLHRELLASRFDPLDFAKVANGFGIDAIEYLSQFYPGKATDKTFLAELKRRAAGEGVASLLIRVDGEGDLGAPTPKARKRAVDTYKKWVDAAAFLGCHSIRVNATRPAGKNPGSEDDQANWVSDGLRRLAEFSDGHGINVLVENQGGLSSKGSWLSEVLNAVHHRRCGSLPDFGAFELAGTEGHDRYSGVRELMPFARAVSARSYDFDARGEETTINYAQMLEIVASAGYHGYVGINYDGERLSERAGIERSKSLLERVRDQLGARADHRG
jgi:L-ribulose-5-phosphate 3-epimerase